MEEIIFSNTEFYFASPENISGSKIILEGDESNHLVKVMRHVINNLIYVTDGKGKIYNSKLVKINKQTCELEIVETFQKIEKYSNITFYIPILKSLDRLEFAFEKCIELGITNFVFFGAEKSIKKKLKKDRLEKISIAAMKQSLQAIKSKIYFIDKLKVEPDYLNIIFEQNAKLKFSDYIMNNSFEKKTNFIFGPESGLTKTEINVIKNSSQVYLTKNRLRAETAIITAASVISAFN